MTVLKALSILEKVASIKPFSLDTEVKFEFGNDVFHTAQLFVADYKIETNNLIIKLAVEKTTCKAKDSCEPPKINKKITVLCNTKKSECC